MADSKLSDCVVRISPPVGLLIKTEVHDPPGGHTVSPGLKGETVFRQEDEWSCEMEIFMGNVTARNGINSTQMESSKDEPFVEYRPAVKSEVLEKDTHVLLADYNKHVNYWNWPEDCSAKGRQPWSPVNWYKTPVANPEHRVALSGEVRVPLGDQRGEVTDTETVGLHVGLSHVVGIVTNTNSRDDEFQSHKNQHPGERRHSCDICGKRFTHRGNLTKHVLTHTGERPHSCDVCGKRFTQRGTLKKHMLTHSGEKHYSCEICGKRFTQRGNLKTHMLTHTGEKHYRYSCEICGKRFTQRCNLKKHMLIHTGERPHSCDICGKRFTERGNLKKHMLTHTGERPHVCEICGKGFTHRCNLKKHMLTHSGEQRHSSDTCGEHFTQRDVIGRHMSSHTGEKC